MKTPHQRFCMACATLAVMTVVPVLQAANTEAANRRAARIAQMTDGAAQTRYMGAYFNDAVLIAAAKHMPNLEQLYAACHGDATDTGLKAVCTLKRLEILLVSGDQITDDGVAQLSTLTRLKELRIRSPNMTDAGLKQLAKLPNLTKLSLYGTKVSATGVAQFQAQLPNCEVRGSLPAISAAK